LLAEKPPAVVGDAHVGVEAAADRRFFGPLINEAQPSPALLFVGAHLAACHGARREQRNGTTAEAPLPLYSRATYGRQRRGVGRCRHEPLPGARRRCRPRRNQ
jgi:hypothetical protein